MKQPAEAPASEFLYDLDDQVVRGTALRNFPDLVHASTTRSFRAQLAPGTTRLQEVQSACALLGLAGMPIYLGEQVHSSNIATVPPTTNSFAACHVFPATDGLVCNTAGKVLVIQTADCAPVFLYDPDARVIGLVHAGWKGTLSRIVQRAVRTMEMVGAKASRIVALLGPMAGECCYEVSDELINHFTTEFTDLPATEIHSGRHLNLVRINARQLEQAGLNLKNISSAGICTIHEHEKFFSYRADKGIAGRILSIIAMIED